MGRTQGHFQVQLEACGEDWAYPGLNSGTRVILCVIPSQGGDPKAESLGAAGGAAGAARTQLDSSLPPFLQTLSTYGVHAQGGKQDRQPAPGGARWEGQTLNKPTA